MATEIYFDAEAGVEVWNGSDVRTDDVIRAMQNDPMIAGLTRWSSDVRGASRRRRGGSSLVDRDRYVTPVRIFDQFHVASDAVENDDTVGGWMETTENLAFSDVTFDCEEPDEQDIWNQVAEDISLDERMREWWRGFSTHSQVYPMVYWGQKTYKVRKTKTGRQSKKVFDRLTVPLAITFLDPLKVCPVGNLMFNRDGLAYIADRTEVDALDAVCNGDPNADAIAQQMVVSKYEATGQERRLLGEQDIPADRLYLMNPRNVFRYTATRMQYQRWASLRLKPVLELLDLKNQLRQMDRAFLVGGVNFILVITQGSDARPGTPTEIAALNSVARSIAKVPLIVGDHRVKVEIVVPPQDHTLSNEKWATIDARVTAYLYRMFMISHGGSKGGDDQVKVAKIVARGLQASRKRQAMSFERNIVRAMYDANDQLTVRPKMKFSPRRIELDFDNALAQLMLDIYDHRDISRDTMLSLVDADQAEEAQKKEYEKEHYDDTFQTIVPFNGPADPAADPADPAAPANPRSAGRRRGGNRGGGGAAPGTGQGQQPQDPRPRSSQRRAAASDEGELEPDDVGPAADE